MSYDTEFEKQKKIAIGVAGAVGIIALGIGFRTTMVTKVPENTVGVYYSATKGVQDTTLNSGYHLKSPIDKIFKLSTEVQTTKVDKVTTQTNDAQYLDSTLDIKWRVSQKNAMTVFSDFKTIENLSDKGINPAVQRAMEEVTVEYNIVEVLGSKRNDVYKSFEENLKKRFAEYGVELVTVTITDTDAGPEIETAIKNEAVKQKEVDTARQEQEKAKIQAQTKQIEAQAEADANAKLASSISDELIRMKEAEARLKHGWVTVKTGEAIVDAGK